MNTLLRACAIGCALIVTTAPTSPALAQTNQLAQPDLRSVDANGVDLISGTYQFSLVEGSIGSPSSGFTVTRTGTNNYGTSSWQNIYVSQSVSGSVRTATVVLGDRSETFTSTSGGAFVAAEGNGSTLTGGLNADFTYTDSGGTVYGFDAGGATDMYGASNLCSHAQSNPNGCFGLLNSITRPSGAQTTMTWDVPSHCSTVFNGDGGLDCTYAWRMTGASNNFGYGLALTYVSNSIPLHSLPSGDWYKRSGTTLSNGSTTSSIGYNYVSGTVTDITDIGSRTWRLTTGTNSFAVRRPGSSSDDVSVTTSAGIVTQIVRDGITTTYSRSVSGSTATWTITDAASHASTVVVNLSVGRITSVTDPLSHTTSYTYDGSGRLTRMTQPEGNYTNYTYDARGNVTEVRQVAKSGSGVPDMVTTASFDSSCSNVVTCNQPNSTTDARGYTTDFTYDGTHGGKLTVTPPAPAGTAPYGSGTRPQTRFSYTQNSGIYELTNVSVCASGSSPSCVGTSDESRFVIGYDSSGNATSVEQRSGNTTGTGALSSTTTATYDGYGNLLTVDGPLSGTGDTTRYRYNSSRQVVGVTSPDPDAGGSLHNRAIRTTYGSDGQATKVEQGTVNSQSDTDWGYFSALEEVDISYDSHHRPVTQSRASGGTTYALTQTSYDSVGRVLCVAQRMNPSTYGSLPSDVCTLATAGTYGNDRITHTSYDNDSRPNVVTTGYAVSGLAADEVTTTYTNNGQIATVTDAMGNLTAYTYDGLDRLDKMQYPSSTQGAGTSNSSDYEQLGYATATIGGNTVSTFLPNSSRLRDGNSITLSYDNLERVTLKDLPGSELDVSYTYDLANHLLTAATSSQTITLSYDALGRNVSEAGPLQTVSRQYDPAGRRTQLSTSGGYQANYSYLLTDEVISMVDGASNTLATFAYDDRGRRTSLSRAGVSTIYGYDDVDRLTSLSNDYSGSTYDITFGYGYDPAGDIVSRTSNNDNFAWGGHYAVNRSYSSNGRNQYTATGSITPTYDNRGNVTSAGSTTYSYSSENHLTSSSAGAGLVYDPLGRLYEVTSGSTDQRFLYDGARLIGEHNSAGSVTNYYVFGPAGDEPLLWYNSGGTSGSYSADERGSVIALANSSGAVTTINSYDEYGIPGSANSGRFQYTGQTWLPELGMFNFRARIYSPTLGRFLQTDPLGYRGGINIYAYVGDDPTNATDPSGMFWRCGRVFYDDPGELKGHCVWIEEPDPASNGGGDEGPTDRAPGPSVPRCRPAPTTSGPGPAHRPPAPPPPPSSPGFMASAVRVVGQQAGERIALGLLGVLGLTMLLTSDTPQISQYRHYGFSADASLFAGGLRPDSYATTAEGPPLTGQQAQSLLALPTRPTLPDAYYVVSVPSTVTVIGPGPVQPKYGQPGGGVEYRFPEGTPPGSVGPPIPIPPC